MKYIIVLVFILVYIFFSKTNKNKTLLFIIFTIPFQLWVQIFGRDALTLTTIFIIVYFVKNYTYIVNTIVKEFKLSILLVIYIFILIISLHQLSTTEILEQFRVIIGFISSIILLFIVINYIKNIDDLINIINIIIIFLIINVLISFIQVLKLDVHFFDIFSPSNSSLIAEFENGGDSYIRPAGLIRDYELFSEWLIMIFPISIWMSLNSRNKLYLFSSLILIIGVILTMTRSAILIIAFELVLIILFYPFLKFKTRINYILKFIPIAIFTIGSFAILLPKHFENMTNRILETESNYKNNENVSVLINRESRYDAFFSNDIRLLGYAKLSDKTGSFHSLYFTHIYKDGIIGFFVIMSVASFLLIKLTNKYFRQKNKIIKGLLFMLLLGYCFSLINQAKVEYLRYSYTMQFFWVYCGLIYSATKLKTVYH